MQGGGPAAEACGFLGPATRWGRPAVRADAGVGGWGCDWGVAKLGELRGVSAGSERWNLEKQL